MPLLRQIVAKDLILDHIKKIRGKQSELAAAAESIKHEQNDHEKEIEHLRKRVKTIAERRRKWQYMFAEELMSEADFRLRKREEDEDERVTLERIEELKAESVGVNPEAAKIMYELPEYWETLDDVDKKEAMQEIFERIVFECDVANGKAAARKGKSLPFRITEVIYN